MQQQYQARISKRDMNLELLKSQLWNDFWVPAAVFPVGVVREEGVLHCALVHAVRRGVHPLHLVEHNAFACDVILHTKPCLLLWFGQIECSSQPRLMETGQVRSLLGKQ